MSLSTSARRFGFGADAVANPRLWKTPFQSPVNSWCFEVTFIGLPEVRPKEGYDRFSREGAGTRSVGREGEGEAVGADPGGPWTR